MQLTEQQAQAVDIRNRSIIVSAAAGSGKTRVLVERLFRILADPNPETRVSADRIIVVTFTKDAAAQMKQRLAKRISAELDSMTKETLHTPEQEAAYHWLTEQRSALGSAKISTIHAFCFDIIRENADECGVSSQFSIIEPAKEHIYKKNALQTVLESWSKEKPEEMEILFQFFCTRNDSELEKVILLLSDYLDSQAFPEYWLKKAAQLCKTSNFFLLHQIQKHFGQGVRDCIKIAEASRSFAQDALISQNDNPYEILLNEDIQKMEAHGIFIEKSDEQSILQSALSKKAEFSPLPRIKKTTPGLNAASKEAFQQIRDMYKKKYDTLVKSDLHPLRYYHEDETIQHQVITLLMQITVQYRDALFHEKQKQSVLSFNDAERLVLNLLGHIREDGILERTALAETLSQQYCVIMVDEYQDSNNKQDCLFKLLSQGCDISQDGQKLYYGNNVFLVGDMKQSIYSFRQANPENFQKALADSIPLEQCSAQEMARIYLNQNFRSAAGILDFINRLFRSVMSRQCGDIDYDIHEQLNFGAEAYQNLSAEYQGVTVVLPKSGNLKPECGDLQAECIADQIADMIAKKIPVLREDGTISPCQYGDFCILLRSVKKYSKAFSEAFRKREMPFSCEDENGFLTLPEIRLIWNLLRIVDNPMSDISMASVLLSPVGGFVPEDLAMLKLTGTGRRLYLQMRSIETQDSVLAKKCRLFLEQLKQMRDIVERLPLETCIYEIYEITDLLSLQSLYENPEQRRENLEFFAQQARNYREHADLTAQSCLSGWLRYLEHLSESEETFYSKNGFSAKTDSISVKTIHKSKGLEYPFIFLTHTERAFNKRPKLPPVLPDESGLLGLQMIDRERYLKINTAAYQYCRRIHDQKERSEEMRLLYVAMTRAKQKLFLVMDHIYTGCKPKTHICNIGELLYEKPDLVPILAAEANSMQDWILQYLLSSPEAPALKKAMDGNQTNHSSIAEYFVWNVDTPLQSGKPEQKSEMQTSPDEEMLKQMQAQLAYHYDEHQAILPSKYSVTQLSNAEAGISAEIPDFMNEDEEGVQRKLQGTARGTAVHKIMQFLDFSAGAENLKEALNLLQESGILNTVERKAVRPGKLQAFFESDFYQRIANSDQIQKEKSFFVRLGELPLPETSILHQDYAGTDGILRGTVDLLFHEPDGWVLVDYKTDHCRTPQELLDKYSLQLGLYQKALQLILDQPVKQAYLYSFDLDKALEIDLNHINYP